MAGSIPGSCKSFFCHFLVGLGSLFREFWDVLGCVWEWFGDVFRQVWDGLGKNVRRGLKIKKIKIDREYLSQVGALQNNIFSIFPVQKIYNLKIEIFKTWSGGAGSSGSSRSQPQGNPV